MTTGPAPTQHMDVFKTLVSATLLACLLNSPLQAEIRLFIESPERDAVSTGIGLISGWAVSDSEIESIEIILDGIDLGAVPYGGSRPDVGAAFPEFPDSDLSGWAMKWNFGNSEAGTHTLEVIATNRNGETKRATREFETRRFDLAFIPDTEEIDLSGASIEHTGPGEIAVFDAELEGRFVDFLLQWNTGSQQYLISDIEYADTQADTNSPPTANAGSDRTVETGDSVSIRGTASDSDGSVTRWQWKQVSGEQLSLSGSSTATVRFNAPEEADTLILELRVTDNDGATATDRVRVAVTEPAPPANQPPTANAGPDLRAEAGAAVLVQGSGSDPDGSISGWRWRQISGPGVSLVGSTSDTVRFNAPEAAASIVLQLTVTDNDGATDSDRVMITVVAPDSDVDGVHLDSMLAAINDARSETHTCAGETTPRGPLPALSLSNGLATAALAHSIDMATNDFFSHTGSNGSSIGDRLWPVWSGTRIAETLAAASNDRSDATIVQGWLDSTSGHCQIIMSSDLTHVGIGKAWNNAVSSGLKYYWTADFGG